ncbi:MAG: asparagine synthase (glutamine-hydrolyzing) [Candidatus Competibacteraceae bacterium]|nr:MAG: asparagine synthase (glutamine-hydrolyzing) [Candidatus Competibacteraceae bacterium]
MCGIAGLITSSPAGSVAVAAMLAVQAHRGPDGSGQWSSSDGRVHLGHRRLAILDLSERGAQPMRDASGRYVITFNGEIYNYLELRTELERLGHTFHTGTDTEVILEAYRSWGEACLQRFNGMFAFALYDTVEQRLFCARDRYGEKPFLFAIQPERFAFASEYKALLKLPGVAADYDELRLLRGLHNPSTGLDADRQTVFQAIQQLLPAEAMTVDARSLQTRIWRYWDVQPNADHARLSETEAIARFRELLTDAVRIRMRSDVPVGSCLSGGLDSSAIVSLVRKVIHPVGDYHTFTGRFPGTAADEWRYAEPVIEETGVISHVVEPTADGFAAELGPFLWYNELPVGSSSQYAQYCVFRLAKTHGITVLLDGQGADELLGGYEQYFQFYVAALRERGELDRLAREEPLIRERYPLALTPPARAWRDRLPFGLRRWLSHRLGIGTSLLYGLQPAVARELAIVNARGRVERFDALTSALYQDSFGMYLTTLLRYGDRNSMAHSREVRLPFCDYRLAELALSLPPGHLMGAVQTKRLLRESTQGILHESVRTRWNKQGFRPPQETWFQGPLLAMAEDLLHSRSFLESAYWDAPWWHRVLERMKKGETQLGWGLWGPFIGEAWKREFVGRCVTDQAL